MEYLAVIERASDGSYSAYVPDLPGCVSSGESAEEVESLIEEAVSAHVESMIRHGEAIPEITAVARLVRPGSIS